MINEIEEVLEEEIVNHTWLEEAVDFDYWVIYTIEDNVYIVKTDTQGEFPPSVLHKV